MSYVRYIFAGAVLVWALGFLWFTVALPQPAQGETTDAVIVPTGGAGRIAQGLAVLEDGLAQKMLVTGVDPEVTPEEFAVEFEVDAAQMVDALRRQLEAIVEPQVERTTDVG